jgi:3-isopropylmalate/(R)-2-methylmalate dehydratase large subunit
MNMPPRTIIEKIWEAHTVTHHQGHPAIIAIDLMLLHEVTSAQAFDMLREKNLPVFNPQRCVATLDHSIPTRNNRFEILDQSAKAQVAALRKNAEEFGIQLHDFDSGKQGIVHVIGPELGLTQPGMTIVCGDSHTSTHGAFGALAFGIGTSEVGHVLASGCLLLMPPKTMSVTFTGKLRRGVYAKDAILKLIAEIGIGGANGHIIEYRGDAISTLSIEERLTICNMSIECGARAGLIAPDEITYSYLKDRPHAPQGDAWKIAVDRWQALCSDPGARYDREITINLDTLDPMVTWGTNPGQGIEISQRIPLLESLSADERKSAEQALAYVKLQAGATLEGTPIDWAFIGSCTNGRIEDLRVVAKIFRGKKLAPHVTCYIVPGSEAVRAQAEREGLHTIFTEAGASWRMPGCSLCLGMNDDKVPAGKRCVSSSNRNFVGRQGTGSYTHLASPATVAASAIAGALASPLPYLQD